MFEQSNILADRTALDKLAGLNIYSFRYTVHVETVVLMSRVEK